MIKFLIGLIMVILFILLICLIVVISEYIGRFIKTKKYYKNLKKIMNAAEFIYVIFMIVLCFITLIVICYKIGSVILIS